MISELPIVESCRDCGACCMRIGLPPFEHYDARDVDWKVLPARLKREVLEEIDRYEYHGNPCLWFDTETRRCRNYDYRPTTCALFEPGNWVCIEDRESYGFELPPIIEKPNGGHEHG